MKRSRDLRLTLMAVAIPAAMTACDSAPPSGRILNYESDCVYAKDVDTEQCRLAYQQAVAKHEQTAPRFESYSDCVDQFGRCDRADGSNGTMSWIPPMGGFLLGYAASELLDRNGRPDCKRVPDQSACRSGGSGSGGYRTIYGASPLYREYRSGDYYKPNGDYVGDSAGAVRGAKGNPAVPTRAITVSRSGFGSSSAARSSFGGGRGFGG